MNESGDAREIGCLAKAATVNETLAKIDALLDGLLGQEPDLEGEKAAPADGVLPSLEDALRKANTRAYGIHARLTKLADRLGE